MTVILRVPRSVRSEGILYIEGDFLEVRKIVAKAHPNAMLTFKELPGGEIDIRAGVIQMVELKA